MKNIIVISALSFALMSGTAFAQAVVSGNVGSGTEVETATPGTAGPTAAEVGTAIGNAVNDVGVAINKGVNSVVDSVGNAPTDAAATVDRNSPGMGDKPLDATATASLRASSEIGIKLDAFGEVGARFFTDGTRTEMVTGTEFAAAFNALTIDQQAELRSSCSGVTEGVTEAAFCDEVSRL